METEPKEKGNDGYSLESLRRGSFVTTNKQLCLQIFFYDTFTNYT